MSAVGDCSGLSGLSACKVSDSACLQPAKLATEGVGSLLLLAAAVAGASVVSHSSSAMLFSLGRRDTVAALAAVSFLASCLIGPRRPLSMALGRGFP